MFPIQCQSLTIAQASIMFYSHHYQHLKCKIIQKYTSITLCSKLISNCIDTIFNIERDLEDFYIQLYQDSIVVGTFEFSYQDLDKVIGINQLEQVHHPNNNIALNGASKKIIQKLGKKRKKYVKFKKQNDCCSLYFTIQTKDIIKAHQINDNEGLLFIYEDYIRNLANKVYKNLQTKAINRIKKIQAKKLNNQRLSLLDVESVICNTGGNRSVRNEKFSIIPTASNNFNNMFSPNTSKSKMGQQCQRNQLQIINQQRSKNKKYTLKEEIGSKKLRSYLHKRLSYKNMNSSNNQFIEISQNNTEIQRVQLFRKSWNGLQTLNKYGGKSYKQKKSEYKLIKMREKVRRMFRKQIQQKQEKAIIPQVRKIKLVDGKIDKDSIQLLSEGVVFPKRMKSQNMQPNDIGIRMQGFLQKYQSQYRRHPNFNSQIFQSQYTGSKILEKQNYCIYDSRGGVQQKVSKSVKYERRTTKIPTTLIYDRSSTIQVFQHQSMSMLSQEQKNRQKPLKSNFRKINKKMVTSYKGNFRPLCKRPYRRSNNKSKTDFNENTIFQSNQKQQKQSEINNKNPKDDQCEVVKENCNQKYRNQYAEDQSQVEIG